MEAEQPVWTIQTIGEVTSRSLTLEPKGAPFAIFATNHTNAKKMETIWAPKSIVRS